MGPGRSPPLFLAQNKEVKEIGNIERLGF